MGRPHIADVVHPHVPLITVAGVTVGVAAGGVVLLQYQDFLAGPGQAGGGGKTADTGADDDGVVGTVEAVGPVAPADADGAGFEFV